MKHYNHISHLWRPAIVAMSLAFATAAVSAQDYYDDDIYYNASKSKSKEKTVQAPKKVADYPAADTYTVEGTRQISVDDYNRHGQFLVPDTLVTDATTVGNNDTFEYTRRIERFSNPQIVAESNDADLIDYYYEQPAANINLYVIDNPWLPYNSWLSPSWTWGYTSPWYWNSWYGPSWSLSWGWDPYWNWSWGWGSSWYPGYPGWGPSWGPSWGPAWYPGYYPGWFPGHGPSWNPGPAHAWRPSSPGSSRPHSPSYVGSGAGTTRPATNAHTVGSSGRPGNMGRPGTSHAVNNAGTQRPANAAPANGGNNQPNYNNNSRGRNNYNSGSSSPSNSRPSYSPSNSGNSGSRGSGSYGGGNSGGNRGAGSSGRGRR